MFNYIDIHIEKNGARLIDFVKDGRNVYAVFDNDEKIKSSELSNISIYCHDCQYQQKIKYRSALKNKIYLCQSCKLKGDRNPFYGKTHSIETKERQSEIKKGKYCGDRNPFYGKTHSEKTKKKLSDINKGKYCGEKNPFYGKTHSEETKKKIVEKGKITNENKTLEEKQKTSLKLKALQEKLKQQDPEKYRQNKRKAAYTSIKSQDHYKRNKLEDKFLNLLKDNNILDFEYSIILGYKQYDFGHKIHRILIEVHGDYWHANPKFYGKDKISINNIQHKNIERDKLKKSFAVNNKKLLLEYWEHDINNFPDKVIQDIKDNIIYNGISLLF
jgi:hypothetical protein